MPFLSCLPFRISYSSYYINIHLFPVHLPLIKFKWSLIVNLLARRSICDVTLNLGGRHKHFPMISTTLRLPRDRVRLSATIFKSSELIPDETVIIFRHNTFVNLIYKGKHWFDAVSC